MSSSVARILVVDDRFEMAETVADGLVERGFDAVAIADGRQALGLVSAGGFDALVTDLRMPDVDGLELLAAARASDPDRPVIVMTAYGAIDSAIESMRRGASHYLTKPFKLDELVIVLERALADRSLRKEARTLRAALGQIGPGGIVAESAGMRDVVAVLERVAASDIPVLITGETGTGKGLIARTIHSESARSRGPFVQINCAALPESLLESELFGHVRGAFSGATRDRPGVFAEAHGGTLFLDEVGDMTTALQAKLLDVLERRAVRAVGGTGERAVDVRVVAATHRDLEERVRRGAFRQDLFYRLDVLRVDLPPLRERRADAPALAERFLAEARASHPRSKVERLGRDVLAFVLEHDWPGNVRELRHFIERIVVLGRDAEATLDDLPQRTRAVPQHGSEASFREPVLPIRELQHRYAAWALERFDNNRARTAEALRIDVKTLAKWLARGDDGDGA